MYQRLGGIVCEVFPDAVDVVELVVSRSTPAQVGNMLFKSHSRVPGYPKVPYLLTRRYGGITLLQVDGLQMSGHRWRSDDQKLRFMHFYYLLCIPNVNCDVFKQSFEYGEPALLNSLSSHLRRAPSVNHLKKLYKRMIF